MLCEEMWGVVGTVRVSRTVVVVGRRRVQRPINSEPLCVCSPPITAATMVVLSLKICIRQCNVVKTMQFEPSTAVYDACRIIRERVPEAQTGQGERSIKQVFEDVTGVCGELLQFNLVLLQSAPVIDVGVTTRGRS